MYLAKPTMSERKDSDHNATKFVAHSTKAMAICGIYKQQTPAQNAPQNFFHISFELLVNEC